MNDMHSYSVCGVRHHITSHHHINVTSSYHGNAVFRDRSQLARRVLHSLGEKKQYCTKSTINLPIEYAIDEFLMIELPGKLL